MAINRYELQGLQRIGAKTTGALSTLLGGLSDMSSFEENPGYNPNDPNSQKYRGKGMFGGIKAKRANEASILDKNRRSANFEDFKKEQEFRSQQEFSNMEKQYAFEKAKIDESSAQIGTDFGKFSSELSPEEYGKIVPPTQTFSSPAEQARYIQGKFGPRASYQDIQIASQPSVIEGKIREGAGKGWMGFGDKGYFDPATREQITPGGIQYRRVPRIIKVETDKIDYTEGPNFGKPIKEERTVYDEVPEMLSPGANIVPRVTVPTPDVIQKYNPTLPQNVQGSFVPDYPSLIGPEMPPKMMTEAPPGIAAQFGPQNQIPLNTQLKEVPPKGKIESAAPPKSTQPQSFKDLIKQGTSNLETNKTPDLEALLRAYAPAAKKGVQNTGEGFLKFLQLLRQAGDSFKENIGKIGEENKPK